MAKKTFFIVGSGSISLSDTDHVATGGEGSLYIKGAHAYKIFLSPERARAAGMQEKITLLRGIQHPYLVTPKDILMDANNQLVGYRMPVVQGTSLMERFSSTWWDAHHYNTAQATEMLVKMKEALLEVHHHQALAVDANEMNWMVEKEEPRLIDCDSWKIGRFDATAIMPSIRDYSQQSFSATSDWFSWGIVAFQLLTGIHPFKGAHPKFKKGDMPARMRANISVFDPDTKYPASVRPFDDIPKGLRDWFFEVFQQGNRSAPPDRFDAAIHKIERSRAAKVKKGTLIKDFFWGTDGVILDVLPEGFLVYTTKAGQFSVLDLETKTDLLNLPPHAETLWKSQQLGFVKKNGKPIVLVLENGMLSATSGGNQVPTRAQTLRVFHNNIYLLVADAAAGLQEIVLQEVQGHWLLGIKASWPILVRSSQFFKTVVVMDCLGVPFIVVPSPQGANPVRAALLKDYRILDAVAADSDLVVLIGMKRSDGQLYRLVLRKSASEMQSESCTLIDSQTSMVVLASGLIAIVADDDKMELVSSKTTNRKLLDGTGVETSTPLLPLVSGMGLLVGNQLYRLKM